MKTKFTFINCFFSLHILLICVTASLGAFDSYVQFYDVKLSEKVVQARNAVSSAINFIPVRLYSYFSGTNTGYGFYAPNVKVNSTLQLEIDGQIYTPQLKTHEGNHMYQVLIGSMTNQVLSEINDPGNEDKQSLEKELNELILKNIGVYTFTNFSGKRSCEDFKVHYCLVNYPSLEEYSRSGQSEAEILRVKSLHINK